jgi:hypothetical protein
MATRFGMAEDRLKGVAAGIGDLFVPMGFARTAAADMTTEVLKLSGALSEWVGGQRSAQEVSDIITKAILGEREAIKSLGVAISEADVDSRLMAKGQAELTGQAREQARALATLEIITEKSSDALAAFEEGQSDAMKAATDMVAAFDEIKLALGEIVLVIAPLVSAFADWIHQTDAEREAIDRAGFGHNAMMVDIAALEEGYRLVTGTAYRFEERLYGTDEASRRAAEAIDDATRATDGLADAQKAAADPLFNAMRAAEQYADILADATADGVITEREFRDIAQAVLGMNSAFAAVDETAATKGLEAIALALGMTADEAARLLGLSYLLPGAMNNLPGDAGVSRGGFPVRHSGGIVPGPTGATVPIMAMAGERIVPTGMSGGGGGSVNVYVAGSVVSERDLVEAVRRGLRRDRIAGGSLEL